MKTIGMTGKKHSEETRAKMREKALLRIQSVETKKLLSKCMKEQWRNGTRTFEQVELSLKKGGEFNKGRKNLKITGEKSIYWKGEAVSYSGLHHWIKRQLGRPEKCVSCGKYEGRMEWANIHHEQSRKLEDYVSLCVSCHRLFDSPKREFVLNIK